MQGISMVSEGAGGLSDRDIASTLELSLSSEIGRLKRVLLIPPDYTRLHSGAGRIVQHLYALLHRTCRVDILPALGTHVAMTPSEIRQMYGREIPPERFYVHSWRRDTVRLGEVPGDLVAQLSDGMMREAIPVEINRRVIDPAYDLVLSIGQVVPHEVVGMANHAKNLFVGCGGAAMINASHMLGALCGMERVMGRDHSPVRRVLDYAEGAFLSGINLSYILTVTTAVGAEVVMHGLFAGRDRGYFEQAIALSQQRNLTLLDEAPRKVVVRLDAAEFRSTWLGNKAIYRTRMAIADGGELVILAPGVERFGEDPAVDALIRRYGYCGRERVLALLEGAGAEDLRENLSAAAHLIHGSPDGRFSVTYCTERLPAQEIRGVHFEHLPYQEAAERYGAARLKPGINALPGGETVFYIDNPATGLWADRARFA